MTTQELEARCLAALAELGDTADEVAESLRNRGIGGKRGCGDRCPLANFLCRETGVSDAEVTDQDISVAAKGDIFHSGAYFLATEPIHDFVTAFDAGRYPLLEN
jgi:hypothetical protein